MDLLGYNSIRKVIHRFGVGWIEESPLISEKKLPS
jgi:hypothetical protein